MAGRCSFPWDGPSCPAGRGKAASAAVMEKAGKIKLKACSLTVWGALRFTAAEGEQETATLRHMELMASVRSNVRLMWQSKECLALVKKTLQAEYVIEDVNSVFEQELGKPQVGADLRILFGESTAAREIFKLQHHLQIAEQMERQNLIVYKLDKSQTAERAVEANVSLYPLPNRLGCMTYFLLKFENMRTPLRSYLTHCKRLNEWSHFDTRLKNEIYVKQERGDMLVQLAARMMDSNQRNEFRNFHTTSEGDPYMRPEGQFVVQIKKRKDEVTVSNLRKPMTESHKGKEHGLEDGVLRNTKLMTYGVNSLQDESHQTEGSFIGREGEQWIQSNAPLFKPVKERGSYQIETIAGGRNFPLKVHVRSAAGDSSLVVE